MERPYASRKKTSNVKRVRAILLVIPVRYLSEFTITGNVKYGKNLAMIVNQAYFDSQAVNRKETINRNQ